MRLALAAVEVAGVGAAPREYVERRLAAAAATSAAAAAAAAVTGDTSRSKGSSKVARRRITVRSKTRSDVGENPFKPRACERTWRRARSTTRPLTTRS